MACGTGITGAFAANGAILSSAALAGNRGQFTVGFADSTEMSAVPNGDVELMYTLTGDSRMTGTVNFLDYSIMQNSYNQTGQDWAQGDWDHNGAVNFLDYSLLQNNYNQHLPASTASATAAARTGNSAAVDVRLSSIAQNPYDTDAAIVGSTQDGSIGYML